MTDVSISKFGVENVRCFGEYQSLIVRPMTLLVGENSTGKTTLLACFDSLLGYFARKAAFPGYLGSPYDMGTFRQIVRAGKDAFKLFLTVQKGGQEVDWMLKVVQLPQGIAPSIESIEVKFSDGKVVLRTAAEQHENRYFVSKAEGRNYEITFPLGKLDRLDFAILTRPSASDLAGDIEDRESLVNYLLEKSKDGGAWWWVGDTLGSFGHAPFRSEPQRVYSHSSSARDPHGLATLQLTARIQRADKKEWESLKKFLLKFGRASGMFDDIQVNSLDDASQAFAISIKVRGHLASIADVGYGVSQILPLLIERRLVPLPPHEQQNTPQKVYFQLQQPEVHLHPRAQAELCSLLSEIAQGHTPVQQAFLIETHSDFFIDRLRIDIMAKKIEHASASLVYLEPKNDNDYVIIHNISFDEQANMSGVPHNYRAFFTKETDRVFGAKS